MEKWLVGVDLGGTTTKLAFINQYGEILHKWEIATDTTGGGSKIVTNIAKTIDAKLRESGLPKSKLLGIGMGAPGPVRAQDGMIFEAINLGWRHYPLRDLLEVETSLPTIIDNDANTAAIGEMWKGAGQGSKDLVCITLGTGVGGGVITNGTIVHGKNGAAGEIGHILVEMENGAPCKCGRKGCLETVASATGIVRLATEALSSDSTKTSLLFEKIAQGRDLTAKLVSECALANDDLSLGIIRKVCRYLGLAITGIANTLNPDKIVIGGGVSKAGDLIIQPVRETFEQYAFPRVAKSTKILAATLGNDAGVIGAAWLIKRKLE